MFSLSHLTRLSHARRVATPVMALALLCTAALPVSADPSVGIVPASGSQTDTFTVGGSGIQPGLALDINFQSPTGTVFSTATLNQVVTIDPDGNFSFGFVPASEFQGERLGTWTAQVCVTGTDSCVSGTFDIGA